MSLIYARIDAITKRLAGRITIVDIVDYGITGVTGTQIGTDLIYLVGEGIEEFMNSYISMVYVYPLLYPHAFLSNIAEKFIVAEIYNTYFPSQSEEGTTPSNFAAIMRQQALDDFQILFDGLGIFVPGATNHSNSIQNDENKTQLNVKAVILLGETLKSFIGYDYDDDSVADSDLFKINSNVPPSFYSTGDMLDLDDSEESVINNVRVRPRYKSNYRNNNRAEISFY